LIPALSQPPLARSFHVFWMILEREIDLFGGDLFGIGGSGSADLGVAPTFRGCLCERQVDKAEFSWLPPKLPADERQVIA
jgi:hypothetical protein